MNYIETKIKNNVLIIFILTTLFYTFEQIILGPFSFITANDTAMHAFPKRIAVVKNFYEYGLSFWFPNVSAGADMYSANNLSYTALREAGILMLIFPAWLAFQITLFFSIFFAGYFTYKISLNHLNLSIPISFFAGFLYQACTPYYFDIAISFLPFFIYYFQKFAIDNFNLKNITLFIILSLFYSSTIGIVNQFSCLLLIIMWSLFINYNPKLNLKKITYFIIFLIILGLYFLPQLISLKENSITSHRTLNLEDGAVCTNFFLCLELKYIMFSSVFQEKIFPWGIYLVIIIITGFYRYKLDIKALIISNFLIIFSFGTIFITLFFKKFILQFDLFLFLKGLNIYRWGEPFSFIYVLGLMLTIKKIKLLTNKFAVSIFLIPVIVFFVFDQIEKRKSNIEIYLSKSHSFTGVFENNLIKDIEKKIHHNDPYRAQNYPGEIISISWLAGYGIEEAGGQNFMVLSEYLDLWNTMVHKNYDNFIKYRDEYTFPVSEFMSFSTMSANDFYNKRKNNEIIDIDEYHNINLLSMMNVKYIYSTSYLKSKYLEPIHLMPEYLVSPGFSKQKLKEKIKTIFGKSYKNFNIYENKLAFPRIYFADNIECFSNKYDLLNQIASASYKDLKKTGYVIDCENHINKNYNIDIANSMLEITKYTPDQISLNLNVKGNGILIITNSFHNSWKAYSENREKRIFKINHAFWGLEVDESDKNIEFKYQPKYLKNNFMIR